MKKTLIALAVAASAVVSGSAMAWTANGTGNSVELGGTLTPVAKVTPWEVKTGNAVTDLDAQIQIGQQVVSVDVKKPIPVLGIRTASTNAFEGKVGISPQINYQGVVDLKGAEYRNFDGLMPLNLKVYDDSGEIGTLTTKILAGGAVSRLNAGDMYSVYPNEDSSTYAFNGGISTVEGSVASFSSLRSRLNALDPTITANFNEQGARDVSEWKAPDFTFADEKYSGFYGSGIEQGQTIKISLKVPAAKAITWKASLPVTVSYM
ncbi:hypothetical protein [Escherichia coli]|uniref:F4 family fimbrial subunit n=1 Tax=Escherichia coli TaxID=562 RepID=UPI000CFC63DB|nr:hypothetical protein [Escherichia coli]